jgi:hypothetical protein
MVEGLIIRICYIRQKLSAYHVSLLASGTTIPETARGLIVALFKSTGNTEQELAPVFDGRAIIILAYTFR